MKEISLAALAAVLLCITVPTMAAYKSIDGQDIIQEQQHTQQQTETQTSKAIDTQTEPTEQACAYSETGLGFDQEFNIPILFDNGVDSMSLHDYLVGALLGEMPASFHMEALKAQAVACRTYVLRQYPSRKHGAAAVCTASTCCECWKQAETVPEEARERAEQAVSETDGMVVTYMGELIEATFFSCSGGRTENAADVWGKEVPYLIAVDSPNEENAPRFAECVVVPLTDFYTKVQAENGEADFSGQPDTWIGAISYTTGGGIKTVQLGGQSFTGKQLRKLFGLNSTNFRITIGTDSLTFETRGYGHRVGMSQYGAQAMAISGADCKTILRHYYTGTEITDGRMFYP